MVLHFCVLSLFKYIILFVFVVISKHQMMCVTNDKSAPPPLFLWFEVGLSFELTSRYSRHIFKKL